MASIPGVTARSSAELQTDYLNLLVVQLKNQNPLEPLANSEMTSQLAQISQLEQLEAANASFKQVLDLVQAGYGSSLIGKQVAFSAEGQAVPRSGRVSEVAMDGGEVSLKVGQVAVPLNSVQAIRE
jgi:flagellar basal-body rod modification protein FlgD